MLVILTFLFFSLLLEANNALQYLVLYLQLPIVIGRLENTANGCTYRKNLFLFWLASFSPRLAIALGFMFFVMIEKFEEVNCVAKPAEDCRTLCKLPAVSEKQDYRRNLNRWVETGRKSNFWRN